MGEIVFEMQEQQEKNWCWAACACSIAECYENNIIPSQCQLASKCLSGGPNCCFNPKSCDEPFELDLALDANGNFVQLIDGPLDITVIVQEIDAGRIIGVRIEYDSGDGHYVCIHGYSNPASPYLSVKDPREEVPSGTMSLDELKNDYLLSGGEWSHTYFTKPATASAPRFAVRSPHFALGDRNILSRTRKSFSEHRVNRPGASLDVALTFQDMFSIPFESLKDRNRIIRKKVGYRTIRREQDKSLTILDYAKRGRTSKLYQIVTDDVYTNKFIGSLQNIYEYQIDKSQTYQLNLLRQSETRVQAIEVQYKGKKENIIIPLSAPKNIFVLNQPYSPNEFYKMLRIEVLKMTFVTGRVVGG